MANGLPALSSGNFTTLNRAVLLLNDVLDVLRLLGPSQWGIFDQFGVRVLDPDNILAVRFQQDQQVSDYPQEAGGFLSYNKVASPFEIKVTMSKGGSDAERGFFLFEVDTIATDTNLYAIVMPDGTYPSVNMSHYDFERSAERGVGLLTIDAWFTEIRVAGSPQFLNQQTAQAAGADTVNVGSVQPQNVGAGVPTTAITQALI
jgi:hypothetical protein